MHIHGEHKFQMSVEMDEVESGTWTKWTWPRTTFISKQTVAKLNKMDI